MNYIRKYFRKFSYEDRMQMRETRTDINIFANEDIRFTNIKVGKVYHYYNHSSNPVWTSDIDTRPAVLQTMKVKILSIPPTDDESRDVTVLVLEDNHRSQSWTGSTMTMDGGCMLPVDPDITDPYEVMKDCKCFLILFSLFVIMLNKLIIFLSQDLEHHLKIVEDRMEKWKKDQWMQIGEDMNFSTDRLQDIWILENERARVLYNSDDEADDK